mgnify:CR=1 FL=1
MVSAGLWAKKLNGRIMKPFHIVDITGQSSVWGTWWKPIVYQVTMSVLAIGRSCSTQVASVSEPSLWKAYAPPA